jgi:hypothetical protein
MWFRTSPLANRILIVLRPPRPTVVVRRRRLVIGEGSEVRGGAPVAYGPAGWRGERRQRIIAGHGGDAPAVIARQSPPGLDYTRPNRTKGEDRMMSVESKQARDGDEVRRWLEAGQTQLASLLELLHEHERLRERVEASERENERLRGVTYENEQLRNRLETSERQGEHLRQTVSELRSENDRHQKEREEAAERLNHLVNEIAQRLRPSAGAPRS